LWSVAFWRGMISQGAYYLFLRRDSERWLGHNPLAQAAMFFMFVLGTLVLIITGLGLYAQGYGWGSGWMNAFGWVTTLLGTPQAVRTVHHFAMWYVLLFAVIHIYMAFREDIMGETSILGAMSNGIRMFKGEPKR
jgi:Ni/Fe-hydrogenase 1 B-type cytochrome subunit